MPVKPSEKEAEYFADRELERRKKLPEEVHRALAEEEKKRLRSSIICGVPSAVWN
jgi:hypothetical protein